MSRSVRNALTFLLLVFATLAVGAYQIDRHDGPQPPAPDGYERIAFNIANTGHFSFSLVNPAAAQAFRPPLYPYMLAGLALLNDDYFEYIRCYYQDGGSDCYLDPYYVPVVQLVLLASGVFLLYLTALNFGAGYRASLFMATAAIVLLSREPAILRHTEALALPLFFGLCFCLSNWFSGKKSIWIIVVASVLLGLLALTRQAFMYFIPVMTILLLLFSGGHNATSLSHARKKAAAICLVVCTVIFGPWLWRDYKITGDPNIGSGYAVVFAVRASYNEMNFREWLTAFVYWTPVIGDDLAQIFFPNEAYRYDLTHPNSFRREGFDRVDEVRREKGLTDAEAKSFFQREILSAPIRTAFVSFPIGYRGLKRSLPFLPFVAIALFFGLRKENRWIVLAITPAIFTFALHAGVTHFRSRYGLPLVGATMPLAALGLTLFLASEPVQHFRKLARARVHMRKERL